MNNNNNIKDKDLKDNIDYINIEQLQDFDVQPSLKSLVSSTIYLNNKVHKYKNEKARIKQLEHDVYENNGHINTGSITLHQGSIIDYEITDETNPKAIVPKSYVDDHTTIDVNDTLHLKNPNISLETDGAVLIHKNNANNGIISSGNIIVQDSNDNEVIKLSTNGNIKAQKIELQYGTIHNNVIVNDDDITNKKFVVDYVDSKFSTDYLSKTSTTLQTVQGPIKFNGTLTIDNGTIDNVPTNNKDIVNKVYVDEKINNESLLKNETVEQTVNGSVKFNDITKIFILSLPIIND